MEISVEEIERKIKIEKKKRKLKKRDEIIECLVENNLLRAVKIALNNNLLEIVPKKYIKQFVRSINGENEEALDIGLVVCKRANISDKNLKDLKEMLEFKKQTKADSESLDALCRG